MKAQEELDLKSGKSLIKFSNKLNEKKYLSLKLNVKCNNCKKTAWCYTDLHKVLNIILIIQAVLTARCSLDAVNQSDIHRSVILGWIILLVLFILKIIVLYRYNNAIQHYSNENLPTVGIIKNNNTQL